MTQFDPDSPVNQLADRFWEAILEAEPDDRHDVRRRALRRSARGSQHRPAGCAPGPSPNRPWPPPARSMAADQPLEDRITLDMVRVVCELQIEQDDQRIDLLRVVDQMGGPQTLLPTVATFQAADTPERFERFITRLRAYPAFMAANIELLREGIASGLTAPRIVTERTIAQLERLLETPPEESVVVQVARVASDEDRERVLAVVRDQVIPADRAFLDALRGAYLAASREDPGLWSAPNGDALYRTQVLAWTTLALEPSEVHQIGLDELEQIEAERRVISRAQGFGDDTAGLSRPPRRRSGQHPPGRRPSCSAGPGRTSTGRWPSPRATSGRCRGPAARSGQSRSTRRRTARSPTTTRPRPTARDRGSTTPTPTTSARGPTRSWPAPPITRRCPATTSRSRWRWRTSA